MVVKSWKLGRNENAHINNLMNKLIWTQLFVMCRVLKNIAVHTIWLTDTVLSIPIVVKLVQADPTAISHTVTN